MSIYVALPHQSTNGSHNTSQDCDIDSSLMPSLLMTVKKLELWTEPPYGTLYQLDCRVDNLAADTIPDFAVEVMPPGCIYNCWNMRPLEEGTLYGLCAYYTEHGGLLGGQMIRWGCICTHPQPKLTLKPLEA